MEKILKHVGVLGMRWGRRKTPEQIEADKAKKLVKSQKDWAKKYNKNYIKAYNRAAKHANNVLIPAINKKYGKYDWGSLTFDGFGNPQGDPKLVRSYKRYMKEYLTKFNEVFDMSMKDLIGERPE